MSVSVVSAEQLAALQGMFPQETAESLRRALREHKGDLDATIEALLTGAPTTTTPKADAPTTTTTGWTCATCTFENAVNQRRCAMCESPNPTTATTPPKVEVVDKPVIGAEALVVPPWWDTFWREHRTTLNCDERAAKEILFAGGRFKNSQILTVDIKSKIYRLLGAEEVHHIAPPDACDDDGDGYHGGGFFLPHPPRGPPHFAPHGHYGPGSGPYLPPPFAGAKR